MKREKIQAISIEHEMKDSYIDYAMSVIVSRALPDVRDGLKPVHRRILYAMDNLNLTPDRAFKKSATIVGDVIGKYHPHGDASVYDALVRMAQDFNLRYKLVEGHGNFGSVDGDPAAAYRYTEARMSSFSVELLADMENETVDFQDNFDASLQEPSVLPCRIPNLLVNGSSGIAVGMATNIPPHNMREVIDGLVRLIDDPEIDDEKLFNIIKAPDFPTGGLIMGLKGCKDAYRTGKGAVIMRAKIELEEEKKKRRFIITEIPYQLNKTKLIEQIADGIKAGKISHCSDLRDESDRNGMRIVIDLSPQAKTQLVLNQLYKHSNLQCSFGIIMLALVDGTPRLLTLREMLTLYLQHRREVITRRSRYLLKKASDRAHIVEGLIRAIDIIDEIISIIRKSQDSKEAAARLIKKYGFTEIQTRAILEMQLQRLTGLQKQKLEEEYRELLQQIGYLEDLLANPRRLEQVMKEELLDVRKRFGDRRRTQIVIEGPQELDHEDLIAEEKVAVTLTEAGFLKRGSFMQGKTVGEFPEQIKNDMVCHTTTHHQLLMLTNMGKIYKIRVHEVPEVSRQARGTAAINLAALESGERVINILAVKNFSDHIQILTVTKKGYVKKSSLSDYESARKAGVFALKIDGGDEVVRAWFLPAEQNLQLIAITGQGAAALLNTEQMELTARISKGTRLLRTQDGDGIACILYTGAGTDLAVATENGMCTRISIHQFTSSGKNKIQIMKVAPGDRLLFAALTTRQALLRFVSLFGQSREIPMMKIPTASRARKGMSVMELAPNDKITAMEAAAEDKAP